MYRLYITPSLGTGSDEDRWRPAYFDGVAKAAMYYGGQMLFLVAADLTPAQDAAIIANADVIVFPFDLSTTIGGANLQNARNALEAALIPAQWVNATDTWLHVARMVGGMFQYMQRLWYYLPTLLVDSSAKLNTQWSSIPVDPYQTAILAAAASLNYTINPAPNDQLRVILESLAGQWGNKPFQLGPYIF